MVLFRTFALILIILLIPATAISDGLNDNYSIGFHAPGVRGTVSAMVEFEGGMVVAGSIFSAGPLPVNHVAYMENPTSGYSTMGDGLEQNIETLTLHEGGILALETYRTYPEPQPQYLHFWDGHDWTQFGDELPGNIYSIASFRGEVYAGPYRWNGNQWEEVFSIIGGIVHQIVWNDHLVCAGTITEFNGIPVQKIAIWDGTAAYGPGDGIEGTISELVVCNGMLVVGGDFTIIGQTGLSDITGWDGESWVSVDWNPAGYYVRSILTIGTFQGHLVASGRGRFSGLVPYNYYSFIQNDEGPWTLIEGTYDKEVHRICATGDQLFLAGPFQGVGDVASKNLIRLNQNYDLVAQNPGMGTTGSIFSGCVYDGKLWVAGSFQYAGLHANSKVATYSPFAEGSVDMVSIIYGSPRPLGRYSNFKKLISSDNWIAGMLENYEGCVSPTYLAWWDTDENLWHTEESDVEAMCEINGYLIGHTGSQIHYRADNSWVPYTDDFSGGAIHCLENINGLLVAGGSFESINGQPVNHLAYYNGSWHGYGSGPAGQVQCLAWSDDTIYAAHKSPSNQVSRYQDGQWTDMGGAFDGDIFCLAVYEDHLFAGGRFQSVDGVQTANLAWWSGESWMPYGSGVRGATNYTTRIDDLVEYDGKLYMMGKFLFAGNRAADNIAYLEGPLFDSRNITGITDGPDHQQWISNSPNPFNPRTRISFSVPGSGRVRLAIYNVRGHLVKNLQNLYLETGRHSIDWDGADSSGRQVPSGIYFVRVSGEDFEYSTKITLAR